MTDIRPLKFGVGNQYFKKDANDALPAKTEKEEVTQKHEKSQVSSNDVLNYMAAANADFVPAKATRTINVSKYVTPEQEARIASFMGNFEADFEEVFNSTMAEFPEMSEAAAQDIALAYINSAY